MTEKEQQLKDITEIKSLMERSSMFLSLSGLSGVFAGIFALIGAAVVYNDFLSVRLGYVPYDEWVSGGGSAEFTATKITFLFIVGMLVLLASLVVGFVFSARKAKREGLSIWDSTARRMLVNLLIPLLSGGAFCLLLIYHGAIGLVAPATLIFYGLALINASKYTFRDIRYLGICEIILGLTASYYIGFGLFFWAAGFGLLHIVYGAAMYFKYERK